jgi:hypothetical protein
VSTVNPGGVDDGDKVPSFDAGEAPRRSAPSLGDLMRVVTLVACLTLWCGARAAAPTISDAIDPTAPCLNYGTPAVTIRGTLFSRIYFGPPGYGETPAQDAREHAFLLLLDAPICVSERLDDVSEAHHNVIVVQLAAIHIDVELLKKAMGLRVSARGEFFEALTGHHRTPVLLDARGIEVP